MVDYIKAVIEYLKTDTDVTALVDTRIYGGELPQDEIGEQPRKAVVIVASGGAEDNSYLPIIRPNIEVYCYGETYFEAGKVDRAVFDAMKSIDREVAGGAIIFSATCTAGGIQLRDELGWGIMWRGYQLVVRQEEI